MQNKIKTALLSYGMSGWVFHEPFISIHPGFEFYAVLERTKNLAAAKHPGILTYRSLEELLGEGEIDLVIVNTPNSTHFDFARKALEAGKHVVVEKPFTASVLQADELIQLAEKKGKVLTVFQNRRWDSDFKTVSNMVQTGLLGKIVEAEIHYDRYNPMLSAKVHKETPGAGIGTIYDLGSHIIDQALQLFGMPQAVFADLEMLRPGSQIDDYFEILLYYPSLRVRLRSSYLVREPLPAYVLHGTKGSFLKQRSDTQELRLQAHETPDAPDWGREAEPADGLLHTEVDGAVVKEHVTTEPGNYLAFYNSLHKAITEGAPAPVLTTEARNVISIIELALESNRQRKVIQVESSK
ncbi:MAG: Gfo/Idh/MocA family oxidoreductase [Chitinophagaceae bacterium]|nr:Gfo/Idh/MocA family oxidoreductase [Chitinophagaceae bacterium]